MTLGRAHKGQQTILVTGGAGFLGQEVVKILLAETDHTIRCLVRPETTQQRFEKILGDQQSHHNRFELFPASFNDADALKDACKNTSVVLHLAASTVGSIPSQIANTVVATENLLNACVARKALSKFVLCSSFGVIGASAINRGEDIDEQVPLETHPELRDPYSFTKLAQEQLLWKYQKKYDLPINVIRPGVIFGPPHSILTPRIGISMFGLFLHLGGKNKIPLTFKTNCAKAIVLAGLNEHITNEAFCIVDDDLPTSSYLLKRYKKQIAPIRHIRIPYLILRQLAKLNTWYSDKTNDHIPKIFTTYKVDAMWQGNNFPNTKAKKMLNWRPETSMDEALDATFEYMKSTLHNVDHK